MSHLCPGDRLVPAHRPEAYWEVLDGRSHAGTIHVFDALERNARFVDEAEVRAALSAGTLVLRRRGMARVGIAAQHEDQALHARAQWLYEVLRRIEALRVELGLSFDAAAARARAQYQREHADEAPAMAFPSRATLYRARRNQHLGLPVLKGGKNKGNLTPRYAAALVEFIEGVIHDKFLVTTSRRTVTELTAYINREARRRGLFDGAHDISRKFVVRAMAGLTADAEYDRMDPLERVAGKSFAKRRIRAAFAFSRIEQDAVHLPFVVDTPHGVCSTLYLVLAIDACTGYPVGWRLVIGAPREMDSLRCLEMYLTPAKEKRFKELGIAHELNVFGTPSLIVFDNGPETRGGRIVRLGSLGIDVKHCKAKEAQGKPFIERLNRSLKEALQRLPGCTRFEGKDGRRDPQALGDRLMRIEELETWIVRWLYESWIHTPLERLRWDELLVTKVKGKTPLERLRHMTEELNEPVSIAPSRQEWMAALYEHRQCTLSAKTGITLEHGFRYKGDAMAALLAKYGDRAQLHVVYDPDDFRKVYVYEADDLPLVTLTHEHAREDSPAWSFAEAKARLDAGMADWAHPIERQQFLHDLDDAVTARPDKPRRKARARGKRDEDQHTVRRAKDASAVTRALQRPLASAAPFGPATAGHSGPGPQSASAADINYDDAPQMPVVHRTTGEQLL